MVDELTGFVDKAGKSHNMSDYAAIVSKEATIQSYRQGTINGLVDSGAELGRISEGQSNKTCEACIKWAGQIVTIAGVIEGIPSIEEAIEDGLFHVNCIHTLEPLSDHEEREMRDELGLPVEVTEEEAEAWRQLNEMWNLH